MTEQGEMARLVAIRSMVAEMSRDIYELELEAKNLEDQLVGGADG